MAHSEVDSSVMPLLKGCLRGFLVMFVVLTLVVLLLLISIASSSLKSMGVLFIRDQVTRMGGVQLWVLLTTQLLVVRFILDFFGPWSTNIPMMNIINIIESLNYSLVHYTLGLMQLSAARPNDYFQVWAVLLVTLQYSVKIGRPYSRSKQIPLLDLMSSFWTANLLRMETFVLLKIPLWLTWALNASRIICYFASIEKAQVINQESNKFVADYMSYEHELPGGKPPSADTAEGDKEFNMNGYKYLVLGEDLALKNIREGRLTDAEKIEQKLLKRRRRVIRLDPKRNELITVEKVWHHIDSGLLGDMADGDNGLKDLCLSFAMYKLLRRRFYDLPVHEARLQTPLEKIQRLVFKYILKDDGKRAFRIVSMELSFLQDLFYSKHASMFANGFPIMSMVLSLLLLTAVGCIAYPIHYIPERMDPTDHNRITHGVLITRVIIFLIVFKELAEIYLYVFSQWAKILMLCSYVKYEWMRHWPMEMAMRVVLRLMKRGTWNEKIHQHNLLISTRGVKIGKYPVMTFPSKFPTGTKMEECTKKAIFNSLRELGFKLEEQEKKQEMELEKEQEKKTELEELEKKQKTKTSLEKEQKIERVRFFVSSDCCLLPQFNWALGFETDTHKVIVWHIATSLCEIAHDSNKARKLKPSSLPVMPFIKKPEGYKPGQHSRRATEQQDDDAIANKWWDDYITAASLSNYCMHLVTRALVPDHSKVTKKILMAVRQEINEMMLVGCNMKSLFSPRISMQDVHDRLMLPKRYWKKRGAGRADISKSLTRQGARLAKELMAKFKKDEARLWEQLAHFWIGLLLYLAVFTKPKRHRVCLAGRRELTTHLWALLSHAGCMGTHGHTSLDAADEERETVDPNTQTATN